MPSKNMFIILGFIWIFDKFNKLQKTVRLSDMMPASIKPHLVINKYVAIMFQKIS